MNIPDLETAVTDAIDSGDEHTMRSVYHDLWCEHGVRTAAIKSEADIPAIEHLVELQQRVADAVEDRMRLSARLASLREPVEPLPEAHVPRKRPSATWQARGPVRFDV